MRCDEFESRLQEALDRRGSLADAPELADHVRSCAECRLTATALEAAIASTAALVVPPCPEGMADRVLDQLQPTVVPRRRTGWTMIPLAAAAGILVALPLGLWLARNHSNDSTAQVAAPPVAGNSQVSITDLAASWFPLPASELAPTRGAINPASEPWSQEVSEGFEPVTRSTTGALESLWKAIATPEDSRS